MLKITEVRNLRDVYGFQLSENVPYFFDVDFESWKKSFTDDIDGEGRTLFSELSVKAVYENDEVIGYAMFSKITLDGKYDGELLILNPVAVKTELQRQHISKEIIETGFEMAKKMGYKAVIVEGNPQNYRNRGFNTSADYGIVAGKTVDIPAVECLMIKELEENALENISGTLEYTIYKTLTQN